MKKQSIKPKVGASKRPNKIDKPLARLIEQEKTFKTLNSKLKEKDITITFTKVKMIKREDYEKLYAKKPDNLVEMDKFLERYKVARVTQEGIKKSKKTYDK